MDIHQINLHIQEQLSQRGLSTVGAVEAARWLDEANLLMDSVTRPGRSLRHLLRQKLISNSWQDKHDCWYIDLEE